MLNLIAEAGANKAFGVGLMLTTFGFGFRHGIDWDHIAALTDITSSQDESRRSMFFATLYALGHALVVFGLGFAAIVLAEQLPSGVDTIMERFVGGTLIVLGLYVFHALITNGREFRMRSRWMLIFSGVRRGIRWARSRSATAEPVEIVHDQSHAPSEVHDHDAVAVGAEPGGRSLSTGRHSHRHRHLVPMPDDPFMNYGKATAFGIGMIHGIGAETPTQVLVFLAAAGAGGKGTGLLLLVCFLIGLLSSNTLIAVAGTFGFLGAARHFKLYVTISILTATFSLVIGTLFLAGHSTLLPGIFGG